jgi:hypothetical protein
MNAGRSESGSSGAARASRIRSARLTFSSWATFPKL